MAAILKVEEWRSPTGRWYVADVHTWTGWRTLADILDKGPEDNTPGEFISYLIDHYDARIDNYVPDKEFIQFSWNKENYRNAHQFKLDINRIARNKKYMVE